MSEPIKVGDVVQLKSGGPRMTVSYLGDGGKMECTWMLKGKVRWATFVAATLTVIPPHDSDGPPQPV